MRRAAALALLALLGGACDRAPREEPPVDAGPALGEPPPEPAAPVADSPPGESDGAIGVRVERRGEREVTVAGRTEEETVQVSVEDGHRVLFGPAEVPVRDGRFRIDLAYEATESPTVFVYVADPLGEHQTVVPLARGDDLAAAGPALADGDVPPLVGLPPGDRRTGFADGVLSSENVRVRWPEAGIGDTWLVLAGQTRLKGFVVAVRRGDEVLASNAEAPEGFAGRWRAFSLRIPVPGGLREGDAVVITPVGGEDDDPELVFQPIRN